MSQYPHVPIIQTTDIFRRFGQAINFLLKGSVDFAHLTNAADDTAAATAGVPVGGVYRNGSVVMVRVT